MNTKHATAAACVAASLALTACSSGVDGFRDEQTKRLAWDAVNCEALKRLDAGPVQAEINMDLLRNDVSPGEIEDARWWSDRLERADKVEDVMQYESGDGFSNLCAGWLWERKKKEPGYMDGYDDFTVEDAQEVGVVK